MKPRQTVAAFTLIELLVVIAIITVLISILLPTIGKVRAQAWKTQDLSNCRQMLAAVTNYAAENKGAFPLGTRDTPVNADDLLWTNSATYDYFLQFCNANTKIYATDVAKNPDLERVITCNSVLGADSIPQTVFATSYYNSSGAPTSSSSFDEMQLGWIYWGGRPYQNWPGYPPQVVLQPEILSTTTGAVTGNLYTMPVKAGQPATTTTIITCYCYSYYAGGSQCFIPHRAQGAYTTGSYAPSNNAPYMLTLMSGLVCGLTDGSARFVPAGELGAVRFDAATPTYYFYDAQAAN